MKLRHEKKHIITKADRDMLIKKLGTIMAPDSHYGNNSYHVRSLYFDDIYDSALSDKLNGASYREKFRIRYYNGDTSHIVLEKKSKTKDLCGKEAVKITKAQAERIVKVDIDFLLNEEAPLCRELYAKMKGGLLRPKVIVDYTRRAFAYKAGNVRITFDYDIRTGLSSTDLFGNIHTIPADLRDPVIMEIKYDEFLPEIIRNMAYIDFRRTSSYSKYTACRLTNY